METKPNHSSTFARLSFGSKQQSHLKARPRHLAEPAGDVEGHPSPFASVVARETACASLLSFALQ